MNGRAITELVLHLGRIASGEGLVEGADSSTVGGTQILCPCQPLLANAIRLRRVPWHDSGYGVTDNKKHRNSRLSNTHAVRGRQAQCPSRSDRQSQGHSCKRPLRIPGPCRGLPTRKCPGPVRQCLAAHARSGGARERQTSLRHLRVVSTSGKRRLQPGGAGALCVRVHERAAASGRARRGLHQLRPGQALDD